MSFFSKRPFSKVRDEKLARRVAGILYPTAAYRLLTVLLVIGAVLCFFLWHNPKAMSLLLLLSAFCNWRVWEVEALREFMRRYSERAEFPAEVVDVLKIETAWQELRKDSNFIVGSAMGILAIVAVFWLLSLLF
jgi:hypothetical protein